MKKEFESRLRSIVNAYEHLATRPNTVDPAWNNGLFERFCNPVITRDHIPVDWRFDLNEQTNPYLMERQGINATLNPGAIEIDGRVLLMVRIEGNDRKSFFAVAESESGTDNFRFWDEPVIMPEFGEPATNVYDMRLVRHEDGWIYGLFCVERKDPNAPPGDESSAVAACGIARTRDLVSWERLPDLNSDAQQRNVVLHPEFVDGKYALYTRPSDGFMDVGQRSGIGWALVESMENAAIENETIIDSKRYHTIKESKNGQGPAPFKTDKGWLHIAHGVRGCAAGLRYVLYAFMTSLDDPAKVIASPGGMLMGPLGWERVGDVSNVLFCNGAVRRDNGELLIYYASSDTRIHVARTTVAKMIDYCLNTPEDGGISSECVKTRCRLIQDNARLIAADETLQSIMIR